MCRNLMLYRKSCLQEAIKKLADEQDVELNKIYIIIMNKLNDNQKRELRDEQREWFEEMNSGAESKFFYSNAVRYYEMTRNRTYYLVDLNSKIDQN